MSWTRKKLKKKRRKTGNRVTGMLQHGTPDDPIDLRRKAEACRLLANTAESHERKALWLKCADDWELIAAKAEQPSAT